jgi:hypothetical protein
MRFSKNKYHVSPPNERTARGRVYASKAEKQYADLLWALVGQPDGICLIVEQPSIRLGEDTVYKPDFLVIPEADDPYCVDVKGMETSEWKKTKILWAKYGRIPLRVVKKSGTKFNTTEIIAP